MTSNAIGAFRWNALGSDRFIKIVTDTLRDHGVSVYTEMNPKPKLTRQAPGFHIIDHVIYHTTLDIPELVSGRSVKPAEDHLMFHWCDVQELKTARLEPAVLCDLLPEWLSTACVGERWASGGDFA